MLLLLARLASNGQPALPEGAFRLASSTNERILNFTYSSP